MIEAAKGGGTEMAKMLKSHYNEVATKKLELNLYRAAYIESASAQNRLRSAEAVMLKWNSHDNVFDYPGPEELNVIGARAWYGFGKAADKAVDGVLNKIPQHFMGAK